MSDIYEFPHQDQRYDEASLWLVKLDRSLSAEEEQALKEWMAADPENKTVLLEAARLWDKMSVLSYLSGLFPEPAQQPLVFPQVAWRVAIPAMLLLLVVMGGWFYSNDSQVPVDQSAGSLATITNNIYQTAVGERKTITLIDGSQIVLNTNTLVKVDYSATQRLLSLEKGEMHIRVAKDHTRPLSVMVLGKVVQAVGTEFNIEITDKQKVELVVTEGKVRVGVHERKLGQQVDSPSEMLSSSSLTVSAGEEVLLGSADETVAQIAPEDINVKLSWRNGNLIFRGETLEDAVKEVGRYTEVEFVFLDDDLKKVRVSGLFRAGDVDGLLATLRKYFAIASQRVDERKILLDSE